MAAQAGFQQAIESTIDVPLVGVPLQRLVGTGDQRYINVLFETIVNPVTGGKSMYVRKRPCLLNTTQPPAGAATGRGIYYWAANATVYTCFANKLYAGTTDLGVTLVGSSGKVWFTETSASSSTQLLIVSDGSDHYNIQTNNTITQIDESDDADFPQSTLGPILFFNDYLYSAKSNGGIYNTDPDDFDSWTSTALISAANRGDNLEAIALQKDQLVAFGKLSTEFFFDNGTTPAPLLPIDQNILQLGLTSKNTLAQAGDTIVWAGQANGPGGLTRGIWLMEGLTKVTEISTPVINRFLNAEGSSISSATAWLGSVAGHLMYCINLSSANRTFVYDLDEKMWCEWSDTSTNKFSGAHVTAVNASLLVQDAANGRVYTLSNSTFQDGGSNITVTIQTDNYHFGTPFRKFQDGFWLIGDNTTGTINVSEADDDYTTFNTARTIDMTKTNKYLSAGGSFFQRAYKIEYTQNAALRLEKIMLMLEVGDA